MSDEKGTIADIRIPTRFTVSQRIEHVVLAVSFIALGLTGLVQKYAWNSTADTLIYMMGGIDTTRLIHRVSAFVFTVQSIFHFMVVAYKIYVRRIELTMFPWLKDVTDALHSIRHSLFLRKDPPQLPRYNFAEKLEYWALIWGGIIMMGTGFMLWNPVFTTKYLPGQFIPAAKAAHGGEAVLAILSIIVWHFYNVHIRTFNKSMFIGRLSRHQMEEEHGGEWNDIVSGKAAQPQSPSVARRRKILFYPLAVLATAVGIGGVWWAATAEATAISTLPEPTSHPAIYSPARPIPVPESRSTIVSAPLVPHPIEGQEQCLMCHGKAGIKSMPSTHLGRPIESCQICHKQKPVPKTSAATSKRTAAKGPKPVPHPKEGDPYKNCMLCHSLGKLKPFPENHSSASLESCLICHK